MADRAECLRRAGILERAADLYGGNSYIGVHEVLYRANGGEYPDWLRVSRKEAFEYGCRTPKAEAVAHLRASAAAYRRAAEVRHAHCEHPKTCNTAKGHHGCVCACADCMARVRSCPCRFCKDGTKRMIP